ncbi:MAG TPA: molybdate ABC transporter substrate-binding protein [Opitutus sp.]|nr:molybdate ABC transporter substrate-binding protein [Opitutus sp.]
MKTCLFLPTALATTGKPARPHAGRAGLKTMWAARCGTARRVGSLHFIFTSFLPALLAIVTFTASASPAQAASEAVSVAAAANLVHALDELNASFRLAEPDGALTVSTGASGNLVAQIKQGAPYDVFLSADVEYPRALIAARQADAASLTRFASGRLVLWTVRDDLPLNSIAAAVTHPKMRKLALANLDTAPYGRAAKQCLEQLGVWEHVAPKLVVGENITQTAQFVETGNADLGFVAMSLVLSPRLQNRGHWVEVAGDLHGPLDHAGVLTLRGANNAAAGRYLKFLHSDAARAVFTRFGYGYPREKDAHE